jgi:putative acetyltransferase
MNATDLATLEVESGPERIETFVELAEIHLRRLHEANWDTTLGIWAGLGPLTVGEHTGIAIGEWHVHAWDLARASGSDHVPADPATVREGQHVLKRATDPGDPWTAVLRGYERDPGWAPSADAYFQRMPTGEISTDDPRTHDVLDLLERHLAFANTHSPPEDVHALAVSGLVDPAVTFFSSRADGKLLGVGAIRELDSQHCELKSMHTAEQARGQGIGRAMVDYLIAVARERGFRQVSIETGTMEAFKPARTLYASSGFETCEPFGEYTNSPNSICMTLWLETPTG